jgi:hypothetical protein
MSVSMSGHQKIRGAIMAMKYVIAGNWLKAEGKKGHLLLYNPLQKIGEDMNNLFSYFIKPGVEEKDLEVSLYREVLKLPTNILQDKVEGNFKIVDL